MKLAFIGLGAMGSLMVRRLATVPGLELALFDLDQHRLDALSGVGRRATSIADAAGDADAVFSVVPADRHVKAVAYELANAAHEGQVYIDFSTIGPDTIEQVATDLGEKGIETIAAGMTQSIEGATDGTLRLYVSGPSELPDVVVPAMEALTAEVRMVGAIGAAKSLKLLNNMVVACLDLAICEALVLGERAGVEHQTTTDALAAHAADSWPLQHHIVNHVLPDDLGPGFFSTRFLMKDMTLCMSLLARHSLPAPFVGLAMSTYRGTCALGHEDDYHMILIRWLERGAGFTGQGQPPAAGREALPAAEELTGTIARGVSALQTLVAVDAVEALAVMGVDKRAAAEHLIAGSAGNDALSAFVESSAGPTHEQVIDDLAGALEIARLLDVSASMFELGRHIAIGRLRAAGRGMSVWG